MSDPTRPIASDARQRARVGRARQAVARAALLALAVALAVPSVAAADEPTPEPASTSAPAADPTPEPAADPTATPAPPDPTPTPEPDPTATPAPDPTPTPDMTATPFPIPTSVTKLGTSVTFFGRGYGHGVGMSQYGARGRALAGQTAEEILAHYYRGTKAGTVPLTTKIRVRVLKDFKASSTKPLVLYARGGTWTMDGSALTFPKDAKITFTPKTASGKTTWRVKVTAAGVTLRDSTTSHVRLRGTSSATLFQVWSRPSSYDTYRGNLRAVLNTAKPLANVVNELALETYLRGVVPAEMPSSWPTEALEAQSVAARSFAARRLRPGVSWYDVADDTSSQVYLGREAEKATTNAAIKATAGQVLRSGSAVANTLFHSAGGGWTEHNENVFVSSTGAKVAGAVTYLRGSSDRTAAGAAYDAASPYASWKTKTYTRAQLSAWFAKDARTNVGTLTALDLRDRGVSGRLISVKLIGSLGTKKVSGDVFRAVFNRYRPAGDPSMRSTLTDVKAIP